MPAYFSFHVQLIDVTPPIWRSFLLEESASFEDLHVAIQDACGWGHHHLFAFHKTSKGPVIAGIPDSADSQPSPDARFVTVASYFTLPKQSCYYQYDFGDDWWHRLTLVDVVVLDERFVQRLVGGGRAFPPEDCGGVTGYEECIAITTGQPVGLAGRDLAERRKWLGDWKPERFELEKARRQFDL